MLNKYLEQLKVNSLNIGELEKDLYYVKNEELDVENRKSIENLILIITNLNKEIKSQNKDKSKEYLNELILNLNSLPDGFFMVLLEHDKIDKVLNDKYSMTDEDILKVYENSSREIDFLKKNLIEFSKKYSFKF